MVMQQQEYDKIGTTHPVSNQVHDLVHELSDRIDAIWRYDQYVQNAEGRQEIQDCWRQIKQHDEQVVTKLKDLLARELQTSDAGLRQGGRMGEAVRAEATAQQAAFRSAGDRPI
jgi:hypothetical protein